MLKKLIIFTLILAFLVVALGAYTRLKDAGLGCPDWPGCYGQLTVPSSNESISAANEAYPERPVEPHKAWIEMVHRYFASTLGLLILGIAYLSYKSHKKDPNTPIVLPFALVGLVIFQGLLGMWTVTLKLYPPAVMGHLLGGFATLSLLWVLYLKLNKLHLAPQSQNRFVDQKNDFDNTDAHTTHNAQNSSHNSADIKATTHNTHPSHIATRKNWLSPLALAALILLTLQIALGGWTSSNYAAIVCTELPICQGDWVSNLNFKEAFQITGFETQTYEFGLHLNPDAKVTIHILHRIGAMVVSSLIIVLGLFAIFKSKRRSTQRIAISMLLILALQISLGLGNIVLHLPLSTAVAHNVVALLLLLNLITLIVAIRGESSWNDPSPKLQS